MNAGIRRTVLDLCVIVLCVRFEAPWWLCPLILFYGIWCYVDGHDEVTDRIRGKKR